MSESYSGGTPSVGIKEYYGGQIPFIRSAEINSETTELFLTEEGLKNSSARLVAVGDILYALYGATSGEVGRARLKGAINQAILAIKPNKDYDSEYLAQWLRKSKHRIIETYLQGGQGNLSGAIVKELSADFPSLKEQKTIGDFFRQLDNLITLHQCKVFYKNIIFKNIKFGGLETENNTSWEQRKLGELSSLITKGTTPLDKNNSGIVNFVKIESIDESSGDITITQRISIDEHNGYLRRSQLKENDILFSIAGTLGRVTSVKSSILPANTNQALAIIRLKDGCLDYVKTYLKGKAVAEFIKKNPTIGAQPNLSLEQVANLEIAIPSVSEQVKIGNYFEKLDNLITLHQRIKIFFTGDYHDKKNK